MGTERQWDTAHDDGNIWIPRASPSDMEIILALFLDPVAMVSLESKTRVYESVDTDLSDIEIPAVFVHAVAMVSLVLDVLMVVL